MSDEPETGSEPEDDEEMPAPLPPASPEARERVSLPEGVESILPDDAPRIQLPLFEGPLDLLLYLIRREKIDIHDIPIAPITRQYMEYLDLMKELNLDVAGEFMVMAATLIHIKSKMLVPVSPTEAQGEEETEDPRDELVDPPELLDLRPRPADDHDATAPPTAAASSITVSISRATRSCAWAPLTTRKVGRSR